MIVEQATIEDLPVILAMRAEASEWLAKRGVEQWAVAWPNPEAQSERILSSIRAGETWMIRTDDGETAGTVALDSFSDPQLWTPAEQAEPAMYLHRLIVRRKYAGLGTDIIGLGVRSSRPTRQPLGPHRRLDRQHRPPPLLREPRLQARTDARPSRLPIRRTVPAPSNRLARSQDRRSADRADEDSADQKQPVRALRAGTLAGPQRTDHLKPGHTVATRRSVEPECPQRVIRSALQ